MSSTNAEDVPDIEGKSAETQQEKPSNDEDEELQVVNVDTTSVEMLELADPTILRMGTVISSRATAKFRYSREELLKLKESPLSLKRPEYLDAAYDNNNGIWDPERWHFDRKSSETSTENGSRSNDSDGHRRRSGDPRERIRKEHDGIVLSPQRRSFNTGCCVPVREPARPNRSHSPLGGKGEAPPHPIGHREISQGPAARRIGSGRIFFDYSEKTEQNNEFVYRRERRDTDRERDERYEKRSFGRETESASSRPKSKDGSFARNGARYDRRRISNENREEEPEWFSEGPISQHDTIELRGFDESEKAGLGKKRTAAQKKKAKERAAKNTENILPTAQTTVKGDAPKTDGPGGRSTPTPLDGNHVETAEQSPIVEKGAAGVALEGENQGRTQSSEVVQETLFTIELMADSIQMLLPNGVGLECSNSSGGSKFSRWFKRERSPPNSKPSAPPDGSRRSSVQDDHHHLIKNILNDISEPTTVSIPTESESYFAPISPAASTGGVAANPGIPQAASQPFNIMEMLQRGKKHQGGPLHADLPPAMKNIEVPGKLLCVEELETRIRQGDGGNASDIVGNMRTNPAKQQHNKTKEDNNAFQKLLAQMQDGQAIPANNGPVSQKGQPMSIMEMLSHSQKQEEAARLAQMMKSSQGPIANDLSYKLQHSQAQQRQIEAFTKLLTSGVHQQQARTPPPLTDIGLAGRELLNRPEAQAILQGLKRGDITPQHLYQQLANPALQSRHRELLQMILKLQGPAVGPAARVLSPVPPHPMFQQQQQQLRVSPLPPNAYCVSPILATSPNTLTVPAMHQRIPSPRELQVHTQTIMQRALIKKKLEEQQENYRKKQELQQREQSPGGISPAKNVASPTQLAFTPTAVLRKMTAEKDDGNKDSLKNDPQNKSQQGRAVTGMRNQPNQQQQTSNQQSQQVQPQQQTQQQQWNSQFQQINKQPAGRPIVKNSANFQQASAAVQQQQQYDQFVYQQQQQRLMNQQHKQFGSGSMQGQYGGGMQYSNNTQQQYLQHQLRAQHQQQQHHVRSQHQHQQQHASFNQQWQQIIQQNPNFDNRQVGRGTGNDGDMSPTSNQLARWFSPDLLERARKGKLPNMPASGRAQHALSLEEIERQSAAPVIHN